MSFFTTDLGIRRSINLEVGELMGLDPILSNATEISFAVLFVALFIWVMKKNDERENRYLKRLDDKNSVITEQQKFISDQTKTMSEISETVKETSNNVREITSEIHSIKEKIEK